MELETLGDVNLKIRLIKKHHNGEINFQQLIHSLYNSGQINITNDDGDEVEVNYGSILNYLAQDNDKIKNSYYQLNNLKHKTSVFRNFNSEKISCRPADKEDSKQLSYVERCTNKRIYFRRCLR